MLKRLLREIRLVFLSYRPTIDPLFCETCGRRLDRAYWANGFPFCDLACSQRHHSDLM